MKALVLRLMLAACLIVLLPSRSPLQARACGFGQECSFGGALECALYMCPQLCGSGRCCFEYYEVSAGCCICSVICNCSS
jgi:hypothetical protein